MARTEVTPAGDGMQVLNIVERFDCRCGGEIFVVLGTCNVSGEYVLDTVHKGGVFVRSKIMKKKDSPESVARLLMHETNVQFEKFCWHNAYKSCFWVVE